MKTLSLIGAGLVAGLLWAAPAAAEGPPALPAICPSPADNGMGNMDMNMGGGLDAAHAAMEEGMDDMNRLMMSGMTASDIDVAFICGMIPHHWGAIVMAKAELANGDDPWARELAQKIITAQEAEIAQMLEWLQKQPQ
ncbi:MAG: DUF305 domain-containing protein [Devosia sp.]